MTNDNAMVCCQLPVVFKQKLINFLSLKGIDYSKGGRTDCEDRRLLPFKFHDSLSCLILKMIQATAAIPLEFAEESKGRFLSVP